MKQNEGKYTVKLKTITYYITYKKLWLNFWRVDLRHILPTVKVNEVNKHSILFQVGYEGQKYFVEFPEYKCNDDLNQKRKDQGVIAAGYTCQQLKSKRTLYRDHEGRPIKSVVSYKAGCELRCVNKNCLPGSGPGSGSIAFNSTAVQHVEKSKSQTLNSNEVTDVVTVSSVHNQPVKHLPKIGGAALRWRKKMKDICKSIVRDSSICKRVVILWKSLLF